MVGGKAQRRQHLVIELRESPAGKTGQLVIDGSPPTQRADDEVGCECAIAGVVERIACARQRVAELGVGDELQGLVCGQACGRSRHQPKR